MVDSPSVEYVAVCADCDLERPMPDRDLAAYVQRVHEDRLGHDVRIELDHDGSLGP